MPTNAMQPDPTEYNQNPVVINDKSSKIYKYQLTLDNYLYYL